MFKLIQTTFTKLQLNHNKHLNTQLIQAHQPRSKLRLCAFDSTVRVSVPQRLAPWSKSPSSEANSSLANQKISCVLYNPKLYHPIGNVPSPVPFLSQINPLHALPSYAFHIYGISSSNLRLRVPHAPPTSSSYPSLLVTECLSLLEDT